MNLLTPVPFWAKYAAMAALLLAACAFTAIKVSVHFQVKEAELNAKLSQSSDDARKAVALQKEKQNAITQVVETHYVTVIGDLDGRLRKPSDSDQSLPPIASSSSVASAHILQPLGACRDTASDPCTVGRTLYNNALMDAAAVDGYASWVQGIGFPTK
ncbi:hypothetical protein UFOVP138_37 [uncultured Caudovirales phage]|uniref:Uncharacterized protein n=1 Tax=uncultured Caudovirales phage TaxID=2100421 RepID=A0A6J5LGL5_9CAUD|nr:hypothetical protein UFOVP138_37 [uncultured Caudovirales phage]